MEGKTNAGGARPLPDPKTAERKVRAWLLRTHPGERPMIGDFRKDVTFAEINRRMHGGEDFYEIANCGESVQREIVFGELARLYGTDYDYWYCLWLHKGLTREEWLARQKAHPDRELMAVAAILTGDGSHGVWRAAVRPEGRK